MPPPVMVNLPSDMRLRAECDEMSNKLKQRTHSTWHLCLELLNLSSETAENAVVQHQIVFLIQLKH